jgi:hypothetical protein
MLHVLETSKIILVCLGRIEDRFNPDYPSARMPFLESQLMRRISGVVYG